MSTENALIGKIVTPYLTRPTMLFIGGFSKQVCHALLLKTYENLAFICVRSKKGCPIIFPEGIA
jgi:hypothetical protein